MNRLPDDLAGATWLITNRDESEAYFQAEIKNRDDWKKALEKMVGIRDCECGYYEWKRRCNDWQ